MEVDVNVRRVVDVKIQALSVTEKIQNQCLMDLLILIHQLIEHQNKSKNYCQKFVKTPEYENSIFSLAKALEKTQNY